MLRSCREEPEAAWLGRGCIEDRPEAIGVEAVLSTSVPSDATAP